MRARAKPMPKPAAPRPANRRALLAQVHMARAQLAMHEDSYRALLARIAGQDSAAAIDDAGLLAVIAEFQRLGWKPRAFRPGSKKPHVRKVWAVWGSMKHLVRDASAEGLRGFVKRMADVDDPEWLDGAQANKVVEALKAWRRREERARQEAEAGDVA